MPVVQCPRVEPSQVHAPVPMVPASEPTWMIVASPLAVVVLAVPVSNSTPTPLTSQHEGIASCVKQHQTIQQPKQVSITERVARR